MGRLLITWIELAWRRPCCMLGTPGRMRAYLRLRLEFKPRETGRASRGVDERAEEGHTTRGKRISLRDRRLPETSGTYRKSPGFAGVCRGLPGARRMGSGRMPTQRVTESGQNLHLGRVCFWGNHSVGRIGVKRWALKDCMCGEMSRGTAVDVDGGWCFELAASAGGVRRNGSRCGRDAGWTTVLGP